MIRYELDHPVGPHKKIDFNKKDFNYGFSTPHGGNFIIPKSGWYNIVITLATSTDGGYNAQLRKNGSNIFWLNNGKWDIGTADTIIYCTVGDIIAAHTYDAGTMSGDPKANNIYIRSVFIMPFNSLFLTNNGNLQIHYLTVQYNSLSRL